MRWLSSVKGKVRRRRPLQKVRAPATTVRVPRAAHLQDRRARVGVIRCCEVRKSIGPESWVSVSLSLSLQGGTSSPPPPPSCSRPQSSDRDDSSSELAQRVAYLETLLQHYAGDIRLDSDNLRHLVDHVEKKDPSSAAAGAAAAGRPPGESESDSDYLAAEDEGFIVQPIGNNVTRTICPSPFSSLRRRRIPRLD